MSSSILALFTAPFVYKDVTEEQQSLFECPFETNSTTGVTYYGSFKEIPELSTQRVVDTGSV